MKNQSLAVTAVGMDHGTSTLARSRPRPRNEPFMTSANASPRTISKDTVRTVKRMVLHTDGQNRVSMRPGGHWTLPPVGVGHWLKQEVGVVLEAGEAAALERARSPG